MSWRPLRNGSREPGSPCATLTLEDIEIFLPHRRTNVCDHESREKCKKSVSHRCVRACVQMRNARSLRECVRIHRRLVMQLYDQVTSDRLMVDARRAGSLWACSQARIEPNGTYNT